MIDGENDFVDSFLENILKFFGSLSNETFYNPENLVFGKPKDEYL